VRCGSEQRHGIGKESTPTATEVNLCTPRLDPSIPQPPLLKALFAWRCRGTIRRRGQFRLPEGLGWTNTLSPGRPVRATPGGDRPEAPGKRHLRKWSGTMNARALHWKSKATAPVALGSPVVISRETFPALCRVTIYVWPWSSCIVRGSESRRNGSSRSATRGGITTGPSGDHAARICQ
jgi:hypothetical protein